MLVYYISNREEDIVKEYSEIIVGFIVEVVLECLTIDSYYLNLSLSSRSYVLNYNRVLKSKLLVFKNTGEI